MVDPSIAAANAESLLEGIEKALDGPQEPSLALWQAVGRVAHASHSLWHRIGALRAKTFHNALEDS